MFVLKYNIDFKMFIIYLIKFLWSGRVCVYEYIKGYFKGINKDYVIIENNNMDNRYLESFGRIKKIIELKHINQ